MFFVSYVKNILDIMSEESVGRSFVNLISQSNNCERLARRTTQLRANSSWLKQFVKHYLHPSANSIEVYLNVFMNFYFQFFLYGN